LSSPFGKGGMRLGLLKDQDKDDDYLIIASLTVMILEVINSLSSGLGNFFFIVGSNRS